MQLIKVFYTFYIVTMISPGAEIHGNIFTAQASPGACFFRTGRQTASTTSCSSTGWLRSGVWWRVCSSSDLWPCTETEHRSRRWRPVFHHSVQGLKGSRGGSLRQRSVSPRPNSTGGCSVCCSEFLKTKGHVPVSVFAFTIQNESTDMTCIFLWLEGDIAWCDMCFVSLWVGWCEYRYFVGDVCILLLCGWCGMTYCVTFLGDVCILLLCDWSDEMYDLIVHRVEADQVIYSTVNKPPKTRMRWASLHPAYQCIPWSTEKQYYFKGYLLVKCLKSYKDFVKFCPVFSLIFS